MSGGCECTSGSLAGAVLGTFFATLCVCLGTAIIVQSLQKKRRTQRIQEEGDKKKEERSRYSSPTFTSESTTYEQSATLPIREPATDCSSGNGRDDTIDFHVNSVPPNPKFCSSAIAGTRNVREAYYTRDSVQNTVFQRSLPNAPSVVSITNSSPYLQEPESVDLFFSGQHPLGLGFTIHGNMSEGIFVESVSDQGPAAGVLQLGDQITRLTLFMDHVVFADALRIFGCLSIYPIQLRVKRRRITAQSCLETTPYRGPMPQRGRPPNFLRQSLGDVSGWFPSSSEHDGSRRHSRPRRTTADQSFCEGGGATFVVNKSTGGKEDSAILEIDHNGSYEEVVKTTEENLGSAIRETEGKGIDEEVASVVNPTDQSQDSAKLSVDHRNSYERANAVVKTTVPNPGSATLVMEQRSSYKVVDSVVKATDQSQDSAILAMYHNGCREGMTSAFKTTCTEPNLDNEILETEHKVSYKVVSPVAKTPDQSQNRAILEMEQAKVTSQSSSQYAAGKEGPSESDRMEQNTASARDDLDLETDNKSGKDVEAVEQLERYDSSGNRVEEDRSHSSGEIKPASVTPIPLLEVIPDGGEAENRKEQLLRERTSKTGVSYFASLEDHFGKFPAQTRNERQKNFNP